MNIQDLWYRKNFLAYLLWPFSWCYRAVIALRRSLYHFGIKKAVNFTLPVVIVGNITVGGVGKTPTVISLAQWFKQQGWRPGIVSRGYGGSATLTPQAVHVNSDPRQVGDEAVLLTQKTQCPMVVCKDRVAAVRKLLHDYKCDLVISDDGLQHLALGRKIEIALIDGERGLGNGFCLPAGPLREPAKRLKKVDVVIHTHSDDRNGMKLIPGEIYQLINPAQSLTKEIFLHHPIHAVAAIGHPQRFFNTLENLGFNVVRHPFPDHYYFKPADFDFGADAIIIMTEKDAVKCREFADERFWCLAVTAELAPQIFEALKCLSLGALACSIGEQTVNLS